MTLCPCVPVSRQSQFPHHTQLCSSWSVGGNQDSLRSNPAEARRYASPLFQRFPHFRWWPLFPKVKESQCRQTALKYCSAANTFPSVCPAHISLLWLSPSFSLSWAATIYLCFISTWVSGIHWFNQGIFLTQSGLGNSPPSEFKMRPRNTSSRLSWLCGWRCQGLYGSHAGDWETEGQRD